MVEKLLNYVFCSIHIFQYFIRMVAQRFIILCKQPFKFPDVATLYFLLYVEIGQVHQGMWDVGFGMWDVGSIKFEEFEEFLLRSSQ